jgi:hypothetical protein
MGEVGSSSSDAVIRKFMLQYSCGANGGEQL